MVYQKPCNLVTVYLYAWVKFYVGKCGCLWLRQGWVSWTVLGRVSSEGAFVASMDMGHAELGSLTHTLCKIISKIHSFLWNVNRQCLNHLNTKPSRSEWVQCWILFNQPVFWRVLFCFIFLTIYYSLCCILIYPFQPCIGETWQPWKSFILLVVFLWAHYT